MTAAKAFKTADGNTYQIRYDLPTVRRIRDALAIDLLSGEGLQKVCGSVIDFALVLYETVADQAEQNGVDRDEFLCSLEGCDEMAVDRWLEALSDFFRRVGKLGLARLATSLVRVERESQQMANDLVDDQTADAAVSKAMAAERSKRRKVIAKMVGTANQIQESAPG